MVQIKTSMRGRHTKSAVHQTMIFRWCHKSNIFCTIYRISKNHLQIAVL